MATLAALLWGLPPIGAYEYTTSGLTPGDPCGDGLTDIDYYFSDAGDAAWNQSKKNTVNSAMNDWELERSNTGVALLDIDEGPIGGNSWRLVLKNAPGGNPSAYGYTLCLEQVREIQLRANLTTADLRDTAAHEMGHVLGFFHVGNADSRDNLEPLMTCSPESSGSPVFAQDDAAVVQKEFVNPGPAQSLHANWGFERWTGGGNTAPRYWSFSGTHTRVQTAGQPIFGGSFALGWKPAEFTSYFQQDVTVTNAASGAFNVTARASVRRPTAGTVTGVVTLEVWTGTRTYGAPGACVFPTGKNQDVVTVQPIAFRTSGSFQPTTDWISLDFASWTLGEIVDGADIRVRVYSSVQASGQWREVDFDNTRLWDS